LDLHCCLNGYLIQSGVSLPDLSQCPVHGSVSHSALPRKNKIATIDFTKGQTLIGVIEVFAPVTNVSPAITTSIHAAA
jgi:hypothetical protein